MLLFAIIGLWIYFGGRMCYFKSLDSNTLNQIAMRLLLPLMFFCSFALKNDNHVDFYVVYVYAVVVSILYWLSFFILSFFESLQKDRAMHAFNISSNHLFLVAAPLSGLILGAEAIVIMALCMFFQFIYLLVAACFCSSDDYNVWDLMSRYYGQSIWVWIAIALGFLASYLPWNSHVMQFFSDSLECLCLVNVMMSAMIMSTKALMVEHVLSESFSFYVAKLVMLSLCLLVVFTEFGINEENLVLLVLMLLSPGIMILGGHPSSPENKYWKKMIAGCNIWYIVAIMVLVVLPDLFF